MSNIEIKSLKTMDSIDFESLDLRFAETVWINVLGGVQKAFDVLKLQEPNWALYIDGEFITAAGVFFYWPGMGEMWQMPSNRVVKHRMIYSKLCRDKVAEVFTKYNLSRLQIQAPDDTLHNRWCAFLGAQKEGTLRNFGPKGDNWAMFSKVR